MSVCYSIFAEVNIDGKWYNLCPYYRAQNGKVKTHSIFWAQSVFTEVYYHLSEYAIGCGIPEDMSWGLREIFHENLDDNKFSLHFSSECGETQAHQSRSNICRNPFEFSGKLSN